jgi:hypothetical protein
MNWYYAKGGSQLGPVSDEDLRAKLSSGELLPSDLVWREGMSDWKPASSVPGLSAASGAPMAPPVAMPPVAAPPNVHHVPTYQQSVAPDPYSTHIPNYLWQSIVLTLLCCLPFGIVAIVHAAKVDGLRTAGALDAAKAASDSARKWCWVAFWCGLVSVVLYVLFGVIVGFSSGLQ